MPPLPGFRLGRLGRNRFIHRTSCLSHGRNLLGHFLTGNHKLIHLYRKENYFHSSRFLGPISASTEDLSVASPHRMRTLQYISPCLSSSQKTTNTIRGLHPGSLTSPWLCPRGLTSKRHQYMNPRGELRTSLGITHKPQRYFVLPVSSQQV